MITIEGLIEAYMKARDNKRRSADQVEFELHWEANILQLYHDVIDRNVRPTAYTFVTDYPKPREVFASDMSTRVLHHYLDIRLRPLLEARMSQHTFNNRVGMGQAACQNALISDIYEVSEGFTKDAWIVKLDMSGCFPNINQDIAYRQLEAVIAEDYKGDDFDDLIYILQVCVFSYPTQHCYRKSERIKWQKVKAGKSLFEKDPGIGAAIGHLIWQNAVNYYFHEIDEWILSQGIAYERFVDDMVFVVSSKDFLLLIPELRRRLAELGARLNESKFYCQHYTKGVEWLGVHIKKDRVYLNSRTVKRGKMKAKKLNRRIDQNRIDFVLSSVNSYLGLCKNVNGYNQAKSILRQMSPKWGKFLSFDRRRVCISAKPEYSLRNRIIAKYSLVKSTKNRKRKLSVKPITPQIFTT